MTTAELQKLNGLLDRLDVPEMRRELSSQSNVRWLLRNVAIRNLQGDTLIKAIILLLKLNRAQRKTG